LPQYGKRLRQMPNRCGNCVSQWRRLSACATILICAMTLRPAAAAPHRLQVHPNPSITILSIAQGQDGFLWLAASDGLYRFDGFHYQKIRDFPFASARFLGVTGDGSLWIGSREGLARYRTRFEVVVREDVQGGLAAFPDQVIVNLESKNALRVRLDGSVSRFNQYMFRDLTVDFSGRLWFTCSYPRAACSMEPNQSAVSQKILLPGDYEQAARDRSGRLWAADRTRAAELENGRPVQVLWRRSSPFGERASPLLSGRNGQLWFIGETIQGMTPALTFRDRKEHMFFPPTAGFEDERGHLWVAASGLGLLEWIPDPGWERWFLEDFDYVKPVQIVRTSGGELIAVTRANLYRLDSESDKWITLPKAARNYESVYPLADGGFLATIRRFGVARLSPAGEVVERLADPLPNSLEYGGIVEDGKGRIWVGNRSAIFRLEGRAGSYRLQAAEFPGKLTRKTAPDLEIDSGGKLWVGYQHGIASLTGEDGWRTFPTADPVEAIGGFAPAGAGSSDDVWVAYERGTRFSRLHPSGDRWTVTDFDSKSGYGPPDTYFLKRDSRGWIWRGSTEGVHISDGRHFAPNDWIHIHLRNGLASDHSSRPSFFEDGDGSVWICGEEGVSHLRPDPAWFENPRNAAPPRITRLEADGKEFWRVGAIPESLEQTPRVLRMEAGSLDASPFRDNPFRYRLPPAIPDWRPSPDGDLEFRGLPPNKYVLEVAYAGQESAPALRFEFRLGPASTRLTWLWLTALALALAAMALAAVRVPALEGLNYHASKAVFLLRLRLSGKSADTSAARDYTGRTLLGRYRLLRSISRGGFSVVYEACDLKQDNGPLAVKVLNASSRDESWVRDRFAYEVASLRSVDHPGVSPILDSWVTPAGEPCLVMPFLAGPTLRMEMAGRALSPDRVARIVRKLGSALAEVHRRGIVHRDLKPENVILWKSAPEGERPILIDFGMASLRGEANRMWNTTLLGGSLHYMPPERLTGHYSQASDVYSFGVMILEMLSGKRLADLGLMVSDDAFPDALGRALYQTVGAENLPLLVENLRRCYSAEPQRRPSDVGPWADTVAELLERL
jgi:ligand-binding sensor domain-containing protein